MAINNTVQTTGKPNLSFGIFGSSPKSSALSQAIGGTQTSTPSIPIMKQNSATNIAYGGNKTVPTGQYTSTTPSILTGLSTAQPTQTKTPGLVKPTVQSLSSNVSTTQSQPTAGISGNVATPSGAIVNTGTGGLVTPPPQQTDAPKEVTYKGIVSDIAKTANDTSSVDKANQDLENLRKQYATAVGNEESRPIPLEFQQGRTQVLGRQFAQQEAAAQSALTNALTARGQTISGLGTAAGYAQPQLAGFNQQSFNPLTGQFAGGGSLQDAVSNVVGKLTRGEMTYNDAVNALSGYGQGGVNALQQSLPPGFNIAQSNTLAGQQGAIGPALQYARTALTNLKNSLSGLKVPGQNSNIPIIGSAASAVSRELGIGGEQTSAKNAALAEARQAIQSVLSSVRGGTPTEYVGQSQAMLPDNATPAQIDAAISTLESLGSAKQNIYGNPGQSNQNQNGTNTGTLSWDSI